MILEPEGISDRIEYCVNLILKEAREERRLVKQTLYTMLSAYTNNPINLAINSPSGEGKSYVLQKVGENFPRDDILFLAGMTDKALFHRSGKLVIKNERGDYQSVEEKIAEIDSEKQEKQDEVNSSSTAELKRARHQQIKELENKKKDLFKNAKKLIELSHKIIVFLDTPRPELFNALMPLLSHDKYEVEYEFTDTHNGIKTRSNILRGWPAVIFAQAIDYSNYSRWPEIQRRFIITNPKMTPEKYGQAVDLIGDKYGLPDFVYQKRVVSDSEKEQVCEIILGLKDKISDICDSVEPGKNNVFIPFREVIAESLPKEKAFDMTIAYRFFGFMGLLATINIHNRPRLVIRKEGSPILQTIPLSLFQDLKETIFLMEYANGVRPCTLDWYYDVFLETYNAKSEPDSRVSNGGGEIKLKEERVAVTTQQLVGTTFERQKKRLSTKQILDTYINPLINQGYIDSLESVVDRRRKIYYPVIPTTKNRKLFETEESNNFSQPSKAIVIDSTLYPDKRCIISKIQEVLRYSEENQFVVRKIENHEGKEITIEELVDQYYNNPEDYFVPGNNKEKPPDDSSAPSTSPIVSGIQIEEDVKNNSVKTDVAADFRIFMRLFYCDKTGTNDENEYEKHGISAHPGKPLYPSKADLERNGLKPQNKHWEI